MRHTRSEQVIRDRVLRGLALNREPGFHFAGNFLDVSFDHVSRAASRLSLAPGPWCVDADGQVDLGSLAMLADLALAAAVRAQLGRATRLATVSMDLELTGVPRIGRLDAAAEFHGFFRKASGRLGQSRVVIASAAGEVAFGSGAFMALRPPPGVTMHPAPTAIATRHRYRRYRGATSSATRSGSCATPKRRSRVLPPTADPSFTVSGAMPRAASRAARPR